MLEDPAPIHCWRCGHARRLHPGDELRALLDTPACLGDLHAETVALVEPSCDCHGFAPAAASALCPSP